MFVYSNKGACLVMLNKEAADLMEEVIAGNIKTVEMLIQRMDNVNAQDSDGFTALILATVKGNIEIVKLLLDKGADVDIETNSGETALYIANNIGYTEIVKLLQDAKAS